MPAARLNDQLDQTLAGMHPQVDPTRYVFASSDAPPPGLEDYFAIIRESEGFTLIVDENRLHEFQIEIPQSSPRWRRIDPGIDTALDAVGVMARISGEFAAHGISVNPIAAVHRDHFFVPEGRAEEALGLLRGIARRAGSRSNPDADRVWELAPDIWVADGEAVRFYTMAYTTRMTIVRLEDGGLWLHSPIRYTKALAAQIEVLGEVAYLIAPNPLHHLFIEGWTQAYPRARCLAAPGVQRKLPDLALTAVTDVDARWQSQIDHVLFSGSSLMQEAVFHHRSSRTLIVTDLIENFDPASLSTKDRLLARLAGVLAPNGSTPRDWKLSFYGRGRTEAARHAEVIRSWMAQRIVMAHGEVVHAGAAAFLDRALAYYLKGHRRG